MHARILSVVWMLSEWASCQNNDPFSGTNHAKNKTARQDPNTYDMYSADLAVDGRTDWPCTLTFGLYDQPSNWTVELGKFINVTGIIIYNRPDFENRLKNFVVYGLTSTSWEEIYNDNNRNAYSNIEIRLDMIEVRVYTSIQVWIPARATPENNERVNPLTLCEVEVYGVPVCETPDLDSHVQIVSHVSHPTLSSIIMTCKAGYIPTEKTIITCNNITGWIGSQPKCSPIQCENPGEVDNGYYVVSNETICDAHNISDLYFQCEIKTICNKGYILRYQSEKTCQADGRWTNEQPICDIVTCGFPGEFSHGKYILDRNDYIPYVSGSLNYLTKIEVQCDTGYKLQNSTERICGSNGTWNGSDPICTIVKCSIKELKTIVNGHYILNRESEFDADFANYNDTVGVVCMKGFKQDSDNLGTCGANGTWSNQPSSCTVVTCLTPKETSYVKYQTWYNTSYGIFTNELPYGASINATCKQGILKAGLQSRYCQENGSWDGGNPVCVSLCYAPEVSNGILKDDNNTLNDIYEEGQNLSLTCLEGYTSSHDGGNFTCQKDHSWSYLPSCLKKVCNTKENQAAIIGAAVGGMLGGALVVCCITAVVVFFQRLRKKKAKESSKPRNSPTDVPASTYMELRQGQEFSSPTSVYSTLDLSEDSKGNTTEEDDKYVNVELGKERTNNE